MAQAQKPDLFFRRNGRVLLNRPVASVQSTTGSRGVRISGSNAGYTMFRGSVKGTGYPLHSPLPLPCVTVCITFQLDSTIGQLSSAQNKRVSGHITSMLVFRIADSQTKQNFYDVISFMIIYIYILYIIIIIIIFVYCNWVVTRWQWLFYMYTKHEIGYY